MSGNNGRLISTATEKNILSTLNRHQAGTSFRPDVFLLADASLKIVRIHATILYEFGRFCAGHEGEIILFEHENIQMRRYNHLLGELQAVYHEASVKLGVSDSVSIILYTICDEGGQCPIHTICRQSGLSKQTVNSALRKLEREELIYLEAMDKKSKIVRLTDKGTAFAGKTSLRILQMENEVLGSWSAQDVERYLMLTERFLLGLKSRVAVLRAQPGDQEVKPK